MKPQKIIHQKCQNVLFSTKYLGKILSPRVVKVMTLLSRDNDSNIFLLMIILQAKTVLSIYTTNNVSCSNDSRTLVDWFEVLQLNEYYNNEYYKSSCEEMSCENKI